MHLVYASGMEPEKKSPRVPDPVNGNSDQSPKDAWLEQQAFAVSDGYNVFFDPYDHLALADEPND